MPWRFLAPGPEQAAAYLVEVPEGLTGARGAGRGLENDVDLADLLVDLPGSGPAAREDRGVARADVAGLAAVRSDGHPAGHDVHELVRLQLPVGRPCRALPDAGLLLAVLPQRVARGLHR